MKRVCWTGFHWIHKWVCAIVEWCWFLSPPCPSPSGLHYSWPGALVFLWLLCKRCYARPALLKISTQIRFKILKDKCKPGHVSTFRVKLAQVAGDPTQQIPLFNTRSCPNLPSSKKYILNVTTTACRKYCKVGFYTRWFVTFTVFLWKVCNKCIKSHRGSHATCSCNCTCTGLEPLEMVPCGPGGVLMPCNKWSEGPTRPIHPTQTVYCRTRPSKR